MTTLRISGSSYGPFLPVDHRTSRQHPALLAGKARVHACAGVHGNAEVAQDTRDALSAVGVRKREGGAVKGVRGVWCVRGV